MFTRPGDVVIDVAADVALAGAARGGGRRYHAAPNPSALPPRSAPARLIVLPWPLPTPSPLVAVLTAYRRRLAAEGRLIVALTPSRVPQPYVEHTHRLMTAARQAGLAYLQHIVVLTTAPAHVADIGDDDPDLGLNLLTFGPGGDVNSDVDDDRR